MSMLSSQRNRFLFLANELESRYFNMNEYANAMRRAADTIWEMRNKLAGTVDQSERIAALEDENARLRSCLSDDAENARQLMGENAKLRECLQEFADAIKNDDGFGVDQGWMLERIRELKIEGES